MLTKFAECYFKNELRAETPFTLAGAKELQRLGILALAIPLGSSLLGSIAEGLAAGLLNTETATAMELYFDNEASLVLGLMFLLGSLLFGILNNILPLIQVSSFWQRAIRGAVILISVVINSLVLRRASKKALIRREEHEKA